jgi:hypothetical protein
VSAAIDDWQVLALAVITTIGVVVCAAVSYSTGRTRWAFAAGFAVLLASSYWANIAGAANDRQTLLSARGIGIGWLTFGFIILPILSWRDSHRGRKRVVEALEQIQAGALEDVK